MFQNRSVIGELGKKPRKCSRYPKTLSRSSDGSFRCGHLRFRSTQIRLAYSCHQAPDPIERIDASARVLSEIMATPDKAIPDKIMSDANASPSCRRHHVRAQD